MDNLWVFGLLMSIALVIALRKAARAVKESDTASRLAKDAAQGLIAKFLK